MCERWQSDYASQYVYGIDFDARSVKIAKALNLIAGDGRTNVYRANTLDPKNWSEEIRVGMKDRLKRFPGGSKMNTFNKKNYRYFDFDVLLTNPPFAGDIKDSRILHQFDLAKKKDEKWNTKMPRDILFIERNLEFLKPGGRMCVVLPQGRFNNISDNNVREFFYDKARVLASISLNINTFKPHTNTKTSVLFLQKWNDNPADGSLCPILLDYPVFFAVSQEGGKDNTGNYNYKLEVDGNPQLDSHGHMIVEHDLDIIADAFNEFAEKEKLSFIEEDN